MKNFKDNLRDNKVVVLVSLIVGVVLFYLLNNIAYKFVGSLF